jgi:anti-sigma regulatory factor (Ser/Thr protein kinase)
MAVCDEGEGFDWRALALRQSDASATHGRGTELYRRYASSVRFNRKGNGVILVRKFETKKGDMTYERSNGNS